LLLIPTAEINRRDRTVAALRAKMKKMSALTRTARPRAIVTCAASVLSTAGARAAG